MLIAEGRGANTKYYIQKGADTGSKKLLGLPDKLTMSFSCSSEQDPLYLRVSGSVINIGYKYVTFKSTTDTYFQYNGELTSLGTFDISNLSVFRFTSRGQRYSGSHIVEVILSNPL